MFTHSIVDGPGGESRLKRRKTSGAFGKGGSADGRSLSDASGSEEDQDELGLVGGRASSSGMAPGRPGRLNPEVTRLMEKFVGYYVEPKHQNARMSSLQLNPHFYPYYHENPLTSSERERVMTTLAESFSGLEFKGNQFFLEQVFKLRPNVLQYIKWVPFEQLTQYGGSTLRGNEVVMDQWIFSTEALEPGSRQVPGQLLNSQRQQDTQAVYNYGVGFRTSLDYFMEPTKLNAYNKNLEALSATILQTMEKQLLQTLFRQSTHYRHKNKYTLPFASESELAKAMSALCNERFAIQKNGAGIRSLESNAFNELRNIGLTPQSVLLSPEVMRHEKVVNPENRILGRVGKSAQESAPAKDGSGYDLQTVRGMQTPTYGLAVNQSRSFRNMETEEFEDPTHTDMYNSSRWSMHPLPHEHENSTEYRTAHRTIGIVDGDREEIRYLTLHDVLEESGMWVTDHKAPDGSHKVWSHKMEEFIGLMRKDKSGLSTLNNLCRGSMTDRVVRAIIRKVLKYSSDPDAHPEAHELWRLVVEPMIKDSKRELPHNMVLDVLIDNDQEEKYFTSDDYPHNLPELKESGIYSNAECKRVFEHFMAMQVFHDGPALIAKKEAESDEAKNARWNHNWGLFHAYCAQRQGEKAQFNRTELSYEDVSKLPFTAGLACAMLEADVPFPLSFNLFRMHEKFVGGGAVYFNRQSVVMAVKSCSLLTTNDADTFQTEVQVKFQAGAVVLDKRSLLAQHNIVAVRYEDGAGTVFHDWSGSRGRRAGRFAGQGPKADLIAIPLPCDEAPRQLYSCILGKVPECLVPNNSQDSVSGCCQAIHNIAASELSFNTREFKGVSIFEPEGVLQPRPEDQIIAMRGACLRYDIHSQRMADTHEGRTALGKACSVEQFQQLKGLGSDLGGDGVRGATFHTQGAFHD